MSISILNRGASGGLKPELTVTAPSGSTIDLLQNSIIVDTYTLGASETEHTFVVNVGTYTVRGTLEGQTKSETVSIDMVAQYSIEIRYFDPLFANNSWEQIIDVCESGNVPDTWAIGNQKAMTINGTSYLIDIIGKNHDMYSDGSGVAPLTFQMHDSYNTVNNMNTSQTNEGGWRDCVARNTYLPNILATMPQSVRESIKEVNKKASAGYESGTIYTTADKLFLLSEVEVFGTTTRSAYGEGSRYAYYSAGNSTVKKVAGSNANWWLRSPKYGTQYNIAGNTKNFCIVNWYNECLDATARDSRYGFAFAFCF